MLNNVVSVAGIAPNHWTLRGRYLNDGARNLVYPYAINDSRFDGDFPRIVVDFNVGNLSTNENNREISANFADKLCVEMFNTVVIPLSSFLIIGFIYKSNNNNSTKYFGDKYCGSGRKCLKNMTLSDIKNVCNSCDKANERCNITIAF